MVKEEHQAHVEEHKRQAVQFKQSHKIKDAPPFTSDCAQLGSCYGVGIGLYFQIISWLRMLLLWLALASVPYIIVINTSRFTTAEFKGQAGAPGVTVLPSFNPLQAFTFAGIMDDMKDNGVLGWMNIQLPGFDGVFALSRPLFLGWISLVDAGSMAVFSVACMVLYKYASRFVKDVDDSTMEVADYTVVIRGLPETTPIDIGQHFRRFGKVMDVVLVKDFGPLLNLASTATSLEQQRRLAEERLARGRNAVAYQRQVKATEKKMAKFMEQAHGQLDAGLELKAVFVTFNTQGEASKCSAGCPKRWLSSWLLKRSDRFLGKYRFWVEAAKPPEDYIYENLHYSRVARYTRMAIVRLAVLAILLVSAAAVTKLMAINISSTRNIVWSSDVMQQKITAAMQACAALCCRAGKPLQLHTG
ncbi:hypothetical protein COO60DRAFT_95334 [Scenedesmus sp. NREL 46B-D3]|nr:hypothetical protein COO60DRAFT_95334 [Scenedesmus sp. NREL 46B-D3]